MFKLSAVIFLLAVSIRLSAQQTDNDSKLFEEAKANAEKGDAEGETQLGMHYAFGTGVPKNYLEAVKWYRKAADQNYAGAQFALGASYARGEGVVQDYGEAVKWFRKAAEQNQANAQFYLSVCCYKGEGTVQNIVEAYKWILLSAALGIDEAKQGTSILEKQMSQEQISEGQELARNFKPIITLKTNAPVQVKDISKSTSTATATGFFITDDGYLISNYHVVKGAAKVRLLTGAGLIDAAVVKVDAANDLALLKAVGRFAPLPIAASRTVKLGGTVATVGFPDIGLQGFAPKLAKGEIASLAGAADDPRYFQISLPVQPGNSGGALVDARGNVVGIVAAKLDASAALAATGSAAGECELRGEEQPALELPGIGAGRGRQTEGAEHEG